ncbi:MAG TPA: hypothetical protein VJT08_03885 [Terriglobales bacterium]|nr:hypothetical protein [Acidobacteriaceae bacterium]HKR29587.1 hypothetical protein [Terriglobales bacterium]
MKYTLFEEAAAEASLGMREIEAQLHRINSEIEHLNAKRNVLEAVSRQLLMLLPVSTHSNQPSASGKPGPSAEPSVPELPLSGDAMPEPDQSSVGEMAHSSSFSLREEIREAWLSMP